MSEWIPVSERLPKLHIEEVYIWPRPDFGDTIHTGMYTTTAKDKEPAWYCSVYESNWGMNEYKVKVTHWMPLPAPPEPKP